MPFYSPERVAAILEAVERLARHTVTPQLCDPHLETARPLTITAEAALRAACQERGETRERLLAAVVTLLEHPRALGTHRAQCIRQETRLQLARAMQANPELDASAAILATHGSFAEDVNIQRIEAVLGAVPKLEARGCRG